MSETAKATPRVFLSYAVQDQHIANLIAGRLSKDGVSVWVDKLEIKPEDSFARTIGDAVRASDYIIVLLSPQSVNNAWVRYELATANSSTLEARGVGILPVLIEDCDIPFDLVHRQYFDLRTGSGLNLARLSEWVRAIPVVDFSRLDRRLFEGLVADLLLHLGFKEVRQEFEPFKGLRVDIAADWATLDPFGGSRTETWLVETRLYREKRADARVLMQLLEYAAMVPAKNYHLLLVTDSQLTSAARDVLASAYPTTRGGSMADITVIEGPQLRSLVLSHERLIDKYFRHLSQPT